MTKKSNWTGVLIGAVMMVAGILGAVFTRTAGIDKEAAASSQMLYAVMLVVVILGTIITVTNAIPKEEHNANTQVMILAAMMAALCYIGFAFLKIDIPVPGTAEKTAFHLGNVFCVLAALFLDGLWGGMAGAVGMTIADLFSGYVTSAPKTFFLKLCIGLITGLVAHHVLNIKQEKDSKALVWKTAIACLCGMAFNVVADPIVGYFYKTYLYGLPQEFAKALAKISAVTTLVNAVVAIISATLLYLALRPVLSRIGVTGRIVQSAAGSEDKSQGSL